MKYLNAGIRHCSATLGEFDWPTGSEPKYDLILKRVAAHEAGHCLFAWFCPSFTVVDVSHGVIDERRIVGMTTAIYPEASWDTAEVFDGITMNMAGIAAESLVFNHLWNGGRGRDLENARELADRLRLIDGWTEPVYRIRREYPDQNHLDISSAFRSPPSAAVRQIMRAAYCSARGHLVDRLATFYRLTAVIFLNPHLANQDLESILGPQT
jgi:ATP-dependent Zn protease